MNLKNKIVFAVFIMAIVIVSSSFISNHLKSSKLETRYDDLAIHGNQQIWDLIIANQYTAMEPAIKSITRDRKLKKALAKQNFEQVRENAKTVFNLLEGEAVLSSLEILDVNGKVVFNAQNSMAENKLNPLAVKAISSKKITTSITQNHLGKLQTELVFPITSRGKVIGAGSYALDLSVAIKQLKQRQNSQVYTSNSKGNLKSSSTVNLDTELNKLQFPLSTAKHLVIKNGSQAYSTTILPIKNITDQLLANIIVIMDNTESYQSQQKINIYAAIFLILISVLMLLFIYFYLNNCLSSLHSISHSLHSVSEGDLTVVIEQSNRKDEIAEIQAAIANTVNKLHQLIAKIKPLVAEVNSASDLLNDSVHQNQNNTDQQKTNITQVLEATQNVTTAVSSLSQYSDDMTNSSQDAVSELEKGSEIIHQTISSIKTIAAQIENAGTVVNQLSLETKTIGGVLDVIKGIAEQTNLLALNAAIEAARAGEAGRGFAVVADEVRNLAGKTQESTEDIEKMIERLRTGAASAVIEMENSQSEVSVCVDYANKTEASMSIIIPKVAEIKDKNIEVSKAIEEQQQSIENINQNVATIDQVAEYSVQQNSETLQISNTLKELSTSLEAMLLQFKV
ncbi:MAG: methyl-accepting chemotaxis protein [Pseudomonadota bacterium]